MRTDDFNYDLPSELIAQIPVPRGTSRMLVLHRSSGRVEHRNISDFPDYLDNRDTVVMNDTRVTARRLKALRPNGLEAEALLLRPLGDTEWQALVRPAKSIRTGTSITLIADPYSSETLPARVVDVLEDGSRILSLPDSPTRDRIAQWGEMPLPPYIHSTLTAVQSERYHTIYAARPGSAASPTAGLHLTHEMLDRIRSRGIRSVMLTLNIGIDTFRPVQVEEIEEHPIHGEIIDIPAETASVINATSGRIVAIGTTTARALESAAITEGPITSNGEQQRCVAACSGETRLFITPGYRFRVVDALLTNFHLPRSTLLMMISALAGREAVMAAYQEAIRERYRFFSFGDAMLII